VLRGLDAKPTTQKEKEAPHEVKDRVTGRNVSKLLERRYRSRGVLSTPAAPEIIVMAQTS
jgi:hypothetical protein